MGEILYNILMSSQKDVKHLLKMKDWLKHSSEAEINSHLMRKLIEGFNNVASTVNALDKPDPEYFITLLDVLLCMFKIKRNKEVLNKLGNEFGNLTIKILTGIEKTDDFFSLLFKFLSLINFVCRYVNLCRLLPRPLFNIFINKKFELIHFQQAIKEFKIICKKFERKEILNFTKENINILKGFSMLTRRIGDIIIQMDIVELILLYVDNDKDLMNGFFTYGNHRVSEILTKLDFSDTTRDSRIFLNTLNESLIFGKKVYSINCHLFYIGNSALLPPSQMDGIWVDVNEDSKRITIFCDNFHSETENSIFLELPLSHVRKIDFQFTSIYGEECYCITMKILKIFQIFPFAKGSDLVCSALTCKNSSRSIFDFVSQAEKLSDKIQDKEKKFHFSFDTFSKMKYSTSPLDDGPQITLKSKNFISTTSPLLLITRENNDNTWEGSQASDREKKQICSRYDTPQTLSKSQKLQVNKISSSIFDVTQQKQTSEKLITEKPVPFRFDGKFLDNSFSEIDNSLGESYESLERENKSGIYSRKLFEEWASSNEDFFFTPENEKLILNSPREPLEKNRPEPNRKFLLYEPEESELRKTSLLDPDGYSFRRWQSETVSERSNFWLQKLQKSNNENSKSIKDIFQFSEEDSDESYPQEKDKFKKTIFKNNKEYGKGGKLEEEKLREWVEILPNQGKYLTQNSSPFPQDNFLTEENENWMEIQTLNEGKKINLKRLKLKNKKINDNNNNKDKLIEMVQHISNEINEYVNKLKKWETKEMFKYFKMAQESIQTLTEMENEWQIRKKKLEKFINYKCFDERSSIKENEKVFKDFKSNLDKIKINKNKKKKVLKAIEKKILSKTEKLIHEKFQQFTTELIDC